MDNIIQIERLRYTICGERTLFHDLINNCPGKSENLKPQGLLRVLLLLCFLFRRSLPKIILESNCFKISQNYIRNTHGRFLQGIGFHIYRN